MLPNIRVIARALPSDKSRLVRLAQELDLVAGMTGDGVNDSPALKKADVGFAMGGGTEVAKEASDIVILDDNFNSIDRAILYGRTIFNSIRKFIVFQLTINVSAVLISFICPLIGIDNPLSVIQILWVNLVMDTLAALAFGGEPALSRFMHEKPKRRTEQIISRNMMSQIITGAGWTFILSLALLVLGSFDADPNVPGVSFLESWGSSVRTPSRAKPICSFTPHTSHSSSSSRCSMRSTQEPTARTCSITSERTRDSLWYSA